MKSKHSRSNEVSKTLKAIGLTQFDEDCTVPECGFNVDQLIPSAKVVVEFGVKTDYIKDQSHFSSLNPESEFCKFQHSFRKTCPAQEHFLHTL